MRRAPFPLLLLIGLLALRPLLAQDWAQPHFDTIEGTQSLGNGIVTALAQDARGFLWAGTTEGLLRYDGYRLRRFHHVPGRPDSLGDDYVRDLQPLPDGRLWVATQSGGLALYDPDRERFSHFRHDPRDPDSLADDGPIELALDSDGSLWIGFGNRGLDRLPAGSRRFQHFPPDPDNPAAVAHATVRSLLVDRHGDLWLGSGNGLQRRRRGGDRFDAIAAAPEAADSLHGKYVYALFEAADGAFWIGTQGHGAARLDPAAGTLHWLPLDAAGLGHPWVDGFVEPRPGQVWVATFGGGIDVFDAAGQRRLQRIRHDPAVPGSLGLDRLVAPLRDRSGLIWVGTWGAGLQRHNPSNADAVRTLRQQQLASGGLSMASVLSLLELDGGRLWIGTGGNGIDLFDPQRGVIAGYRPDGERLGALRDGTIRALLGAADGRHWVGTQQAGVFRYRPASDDFEPLAAELPDQRIRILAGLQDGRVAVGTQRGLAVLGADGTVATPLLADGSVMREAVWSVLEDAAGTLWVGTPGRLLRGSAGAGRLQMETGDPGSVPEGVLDLRQGDDGSLFALAVNGLFRRGADAGWMPLALPLDSETASLGRQLLIDRRGQLWTPRYRIDPQRLELQALGRADGIEVGNVDMGGALRLRNGDLAFAGTRGLLLIDPLRFRDWPFAPPLQPTALQIDTDSQPLATLWPQLRLAPGQQRFSLEFAALDFSAPQANRYAYRLEGLDRDWQFGDAGRRVATYNNLWPGRYRLQVRGSNRNGLWSPQTLNLEIEVLPLWWQTPWAAAALIATIGLLIGLAWRWRTRRILQQASQLSALVDERTHELSQARDRAEQSLRKLTETQDQLVAAEKMAALGHLVAGVAHEINTPLGIALTASSHLREVALRARTAVEGGQVSRRDLRGWHEALVDGSAIVLDSLERANGLVASFKRVAVDRSQEPRSRFTLGEMSDELRLSLEPACRRAGHNLEVVCTADAALDSYPGALFQVVASLVGNALQHAFDEGRCGRIEVTLSADASSASVSVVDDGRGMNAETAARAFDPFFTTRRGAGGATGLGLHIVHNQVSQVLGGSIRLQSTPGTGTRFELQLPLQAGRRDRGDSAPIPGLGSLGATAD